jgi:murein DD-endopeptidase MepM/ murein hydrolase activator NlpD
MARIKFRYNSETCCYEPSYVKGKALTKRFFAFFILSFIVASGSYLFVRNHFETVGELLLAQENQKLKIEWKILHQRVEQSNQKLAAFIDKDDNNYRVILDTPPLSANIREAGVGGTERINYKLLKDFPGVIQEYVAIEKLKHQLDIEIQSYQEINKTLDQKLSMWKSRPAIQPISNKELLRVSSVFGYRFHPILKFWRDHNGLDLAAIYGTPVYATGDGRISRSDFSASYGYVIYINHGFNYETRYAHLSKFIVAHGDHVKRGQLIGYVGSTGISESPHLHYEVLNNNAPVNPMDFFQRDLSNEEFQKIVDEAQK